VARIRLEGESEEVVPIVDVTPETGQSAEFAIETNTNVSVVLTGHLVRTAQGYGLMVASNHIPMLGVVEAETTFWGVPADHSHDAMRGAFCRNGGSGLPASTCEGGNKEAGVPNVPFLTMPANCAAGPEQAVVRVDSWQEPGSVVDGEYSKQYKQTSATIPGATGCDALAFSPQIEVEPDTFAADEPVGLGINLGVPLNEKPTGDATPQVRDTVVTLPSGMSVSSGVVDGIEACEEFGPQGINITGPESEEIGLNGESQLAPGHCPDASTVGTVEAITPLLPVPVKGHVYLARPLCGGLGQSQCTEEDALNGKLYRLFLEVGGTGEFAQTGVHFKVPLETSANLATGQLTTRALGTPQVPFSELKVRLNGGPRAPIANPGTCGLAMTRADLRSWSAPGETSEHLFVTGIPDATPTSFFNVTGCSSPTPFAPSAIAGTALPNAGKFSAFTMSLSRKDREQYLTGVQVLTPPGLSGVLAGIPLCGEADAESGHCPSSSKIGTTKVAAGAGSHPFELEGDVYLTGPHDGAPFGLSVVTDAVAGPFHLGLVVVRARIEVDQHDSTLRVSTDSSGPHAVPQIIFGVPLRLQRVTVNIDRSHFMLNPTNCSKHEITVRMSGSQGAVAAVTTPFYVGGCKTLAFKPRFTASTSGHTSRKNGASLDTKLSYPKNALGVDTNIASVKVDLPKQLPSRLTTLQQACPAVTFTTNPANCPGASVVGIVRARTPLLADKLEGPVYFVSHGGDAFPSLIVVLQGDHVRVDLTGTTFISKKGITSSTFKTIPDVPVETFELYLPQGRNSALAANGNLCTSKKRLVMPTVFTAQNGARFKQDTKISVTNCGARQAKMAALTPLTYHRANNGRGGGLR
jgi:hypothetical protein